MDWAELRHWPGNLSVITPRRGGTEHGFFREGVLWPGSPRNFATEPATFYDSAIFTPLGTTFEVEFTEISGGGGFQLGPWGSALAYGGIQPRFSAIAGGVVSSYYPFGTGWIEVPIGSVVHITGSVQNNTLQATLTIGTTTYQGSRALTAGSMPTFPSNATNGNITNLSAHIADSAGKTVWSYPSISERLRLITNTNIINTGTHWEAANPALGWSIKTALPAGIAGTVLAKINGEYIVNPAQWNRTTATFTGAATDTLEGLIVFNEVITYEQIAYLCGVKRWVIPVSAGNINIVTVGFQNLRWTFPDGSTSTAESINQTVATGVITCEYVGLLNGRLTINGSTALASSAMRAIDLPRVTNYLHLFSLPGLTGTIADLPRATGILYLYNLPGLTGTTADLPRVTTLTINNLPGLTGTIADLPRATGILYLYNLLGLTGATVDLPRATGTLYLYNLPGLTGTTADLPVNVGERRCYIVANVTGALSVVATNTPIYFYATGATALEYDETVHNCVVAGGLSKTLHIGTGTSAGDADIQALRDRGWSVTIH